MMTTTIVEVPVSDDLLPEIDEAARAERQTRSEFLSDVARRYVSERRWERIQADVSKRARAAGIYTEDDVEDFLDSIEN